MREFSGETYHPTLTAQFGPVKLNLLSDCSDLKIDTFLSSLPSLNSCEKGGISYSYKDDRTHEDNNIRVIIKHVEKPGFSVVKKNEYNISGPIENRSFRNQVPRILYAIAERYRQAHHNEYTIHAAGVFIPHLKKSILVLGDKGSGKSNLVYALCTKLNGKLVGNDLVIIKRNDHKNRIILTGGVPELKIRRRVARFFFPEIEEGVSSSVIQSALSYEDKINIELPHHLKHFEPSEVGLIVRINLHQCAQECEITNQFNKQQEAIRLNELLARHIKAQTSVLSISVDGIIEGYLPSLDCPEANNNRLEMIQSILAEEFIYMESNSPIIAAESIIKRMSSKP